MTQRYMKVFAAASVLAVAGTGLTAFAQPGQSHPADQQALVALKNAYENALNANDLAGLSQLFDHLAKDFEYTMITGDVIRSRKQWEEGWTRVLDAIGKKDGGSYRVVVKPVEGGTHWLDKQGLAVSYGTTEETLVIAQPTQTGAPIRLTRQFKSLWSVVCRKESGKWKLVSAHVTPLSHPFTQQEIAMVKAAWTGKTSAQ